LNIKFAIATLENLSFFQTNFQHQDVPFPGLQGLGANSALEIDP
jgi:hypothetical protein